MDEQLRRKVLHVFREHGVPPEILVVLPEAEDEVVFVVPHEATPFIEESALTTALTVVLGKKVWVTRGLSPWVGRTAPL